MMSSEDSIAFVRSRQAPRPSLSSERAGLATDVSKFGGGPSEVAKGRRGSVPPIGEFCAHGLLLSETPALVVGRLHSVDRFGYERPFGAFPTLRSVWSRVCEGSYPTA